MKAFYKIKTVDLYHLTYVSEPPLTNSFSYQDQIFLF